MTRVNHIRLMVSAIGVPAIALLAANAAHLIGAPAFKVDKYDIKVKAVLTM